MQGSLDLLSSSLLCLGYKECNKYGGFANYIAAEWFRITAIYGAPWHNLGHSVKEKIK